MALAQGFNWRLPFKSQKAYLTVNTISTVVTLNDQVTTLKDILTSASVGFKPGIITLIRLNRENKEYSILLLTFTVTR